MSWVNWIRPLLLAVVLSCLPASSYAVTKSAGCGLPGRQTGDFHLRTTDNRGTQRDYEVIVPASYNPSIPLSLSLVFHGAGGTQGDAKAYGLQNAPGASGAGIFIFPQGVWYQQYGVGWDDSCGGYDVAFVDKILASMQSNYCIDTERVYVAGFSWGCDFVTALACCRGNKIRAVAAASCSDDFRVAQDVTSYKQSPCPVANKAAIRFTHATSGDWGYPAPYFATTSKLYRSFNGCSTNSVPSTPAQCRSFSGCRNPFIECSYDNLGHALPAGWAADTWKFFTTGAGSWTARAPMQTPSPASSTAMSAPLGLGFGSFALAFLVVGGSVLVVRRRPPSSRQTDSGS